MWGYGEMFVWFTEVIFRPTLAYAPILKSPKKEISSEDQELYTFKRGAFVLDCKNGPLRYHFRGKSTTLNKWFASLVYNDTLVPKGNHIDGLTIALQRHEYANVYWTMIDLYDAFLIMKFMNASHARVVLVDAHPGGLLDELWNIIYPGSAQLHTIKNNTQYAELVWAFHRGNTPLKQRNEQPPLLNDFRDYVLSQAGLSLRHHVNCAQRSLRVLFVWRRDYVSHVRNVKGTVQRKISNEDALLQACAAAFPQWRIQGVQLDLYPIREQLQLISESDILIGMHGAAFAYNVVMQPGSGVIELFPAYHGENWHMAFMAEQAGLHYVSWKNTDTTIENKAAGTTKVPPSVVVRLLRAMEKTICNAWH